MSKEKYFMHIYHRNINPLTGEDGALTAGASPGHLYVGLEGGGREHFFGRYPSGNVVVSKEAIRTKGEEKKHEDTKDIVKRYKHPTAKITFKSISITQEQFKATFKYGESKALGEGGGNISS